MSGIAGIQGPYTDGLMNEVLERIVHRGPGDRKIWQTGTGIVLGQAYALSTSVESFDADRVAVVDGEILGQSGMSSQAAVLAHYQEHGVSFVEHLPENAFALLLADGDSLMAARDPMGIKPLYYGTSPEGRLMFASEIKGLVDFLDDIRVFPPGHYYHSDHGMVRYSDEPVLGQGTMELEDAIPEVKSLLVNAIDRLHQPGDSLGVYLSGGIDSSVITAAAVEVADDVHTFSVGFASSSDLPQARLVAEHLGTQHEEYQFDLDDYQRALPEVIYYLESYDAPLVRSSVANYLLSGMAQKNNVNLVLSGEGGDELFAGYLYLKEFAPEVIEEKICQLILSGHSNGFQRVDRTNMAHSVEAHMPLLDHRMTEYAFGLPVEWKMKDEEDRRIEKWILRKAFEHDLPESIVWREKEKFYEGSGAEGVVDSFADSLMSDAEFQAGLPEVRQLGIESKEELHYYRLFREHYPHESILETVGRTATLG